jgi:hypothetical protein
MLLEAAAVANDYITNSSPLANMLTAAGVSAWTIKKLKEWNRVTWINNNSDKINRAISVGFALATTWGLHFAFHDDTSGIHHGGILEIGLPSASEFLNASWKTLGSYMLQQGALRGFVEHEKGLRAVDTVAEKVEENKDKLAKEVEHADDSDTTALKLREPRKVEPPPGDGPIDWKWNSKP